MTQKYADLNKEIDFEVIDTNDKVLCKYCKKPISKSKKEEYIQITETQYAHIKCSEEEAKREKSDVELLDEYIMKLFGYEYVPPRAKKQINDYISQYNFTYSGMLKALIYFYEIRGGSIEDAHDGVGILPYIYNDAREYYYNLWAAQQKNIYKDIKQFRPETIEVHIARPERNILKRKLFSFLDEEVENAE